MQARADSPTDARTRLAWLARDIEVKPQPYRQLTKVLSEMGDDDGARLVLFEMERRIRAHEREHLPWAERPFAVLNDKALDWTIGYGLYPLHALRWTAALWAVGWIIRRAQMIGAMAPTEKDAYKELHEKGSLPEGYQPFSPPIYSLENCIPLIKLGQDDRWEPDPNPKSRQIQPPRKQG